MLISKHCYQMRPQVLYDYTSVWEELSLQESFWHSYCWKTVAIICSIL